MGRCLLVCRFDSDVDTHLPSQLLVVLVQMLFFEFALSELLLQLLDVTLELDVFPFIFSIGLLHKLLHFEFELSFKFIHFTLHYLL